MCERINKIAVTISAAWLLAGGSTLAPERTAAANLMGKNINEAYRVFGNPLFVSTETSVSTESKFYGHNFISFILRDLNTIRKSSTVLIWIRHKAVRFWLISSKHNMCRSHVELDSGLIPKRT